MIQITLITRSPLHLADTFTVSPLSGTLLAIPGRSLRGALAGLHSVDDADFTARFLDSRNWFGPLWPLGSEYESFQSAQLLPATARTCKLQKGFKGTGGHGVRDMLYELLKQAGPRLEAETCADEGCGAKLVPYSGYYGELDGRKRSISSDRRLITKTAIDSQRESAATAQLYSREVIGEGFRFAGFVSIADGGQEAAMVALLSPGLCLQLGSGRSRGLGQVEVICVERQGVNEWLPVAPLADRLREFDRRAREAGVDCPQQTIFSITLRSDAVFLDQYLRPMMQLTPDYLGRFMHQQLAAANPLGAFAETRVIDGWNDAHGLPRDSMTAIAAGSTFAFGIDMPPAELAPLLTPVESIGVGELRGEGFGRAIINHPFHLEEDMI